MSFRADTNRRKQFKQGINFEDARRKREDNIVELRRQKKDESLQKKRQADVSQDASQNFQESTAVAVSSGGFEEASTAGAHLSGDTLYQQLVQELNSDDQKVQLSSLVSFRKLLSVEKAPPIEKVVSLGIVPQFISFLKRNDNTSFQFEAAWILTNIASGDTTHTQKIVDLGAVPIFVQILNSPSEDVREQAVWALGNIAGDNTKCRDYVLSCNTLEPLLELPQSSAKLVLVRNATWTLSNLCRGKPQPDFKVVSKAIPYLAVILNVDDDEVLVDACWALSYLSDGEDFRIEALLQTKIASRLVQLLGHQNTNIVIPALRNVGNIVTGDDSQTQQIIKAGALPYLHGLITNNSKKSIKKEACWTLSNVTAGTKEQVMAVIQAGLMQPLIQLLDKSEFDIQKEAAWAICNATSLKDPQIIEYIVQSGCMRPLCNMLSVFDNKIIIIIIDGLDNILRVGEDIKHQCEGINPYVLAVEEADGLDKLEALENHQSQEVYQRAGMLIKQYFELEEDDDMPTYAMDEPNAINQEASTSSTQQQAFNFGASNF